MARRECDGIGAFGCWALLCTGVLCGDQQSSKRDGELAAFVAAIVLSLYLSIYLLYAVYCLEEGVKLLGEDCIAIGSAALHLISFMCAPLSLCRLLSVQLHIHCVQSGSQCALSLGHAVECGASVYIAMSLTAGECLLGDECCCTNCLTLSSCANLTLSRATSLFIRAFSFSNRCNTADCGSTFSLSTDDTDTVLSFSSDSHDAPSLLSSTTAV